MSKLNGSLLIVYLTAAAGFGGWRGPDLWSGWSVWCLLLPPLVWAALKAAGEWRRNPYWLSIKIGFVMTVVAVVAIGGQAVILAWVVGEGTARLSSKPAVRAIAGVGLLAAVGAMVLANRKFGKPAAPQATNPSVNSDRADEDFAPDQSRK